MPLFDFVCEKCHRRSEVLVRGNERPLCPFCGADLLVKQASVFAPITASSVRPQAPAGCASTSCARLQDGSCPRL